MIVAPLSRRARAFAGAVAASSMFASAEALERIGLDGRVALASEALAVRSPSLAIEPYATPVERAVANSSQPFGAEAAQVGYRGWLRHGRFGFGLGVGAVVVRANSPADGTARFGAADGAMFSALPDPVLTVGVSYRLSDRSAIYADAERLYGAPLAGNAKAGLQLKSAQPQWNLAYGGLGLRLAGDTRVSLKLRKGGMVIAMRRTF